MSVEAIGEDRAAATVRPVEPACDAGAESHHAARERRRVRRLDQEVSVSGLQRVVHEAEVTAVARRSEAALERADEGDGAQRREAGKNLHGHVCWKAGGHIIPRAVKNTRLRPALASGAGPRASPVVVVSQMEIEL